MEKSNQPEEPRDDSLPEFMRQETGSEEAARVLNEAGTQTDRPRKPFSRPPKGANQAAVVLLVVFLLIWIAIKVLSR